MFTLPKQPQHALRVQEELAGRHCQQQLLCKPTIPCSQHTMTGTAGVDRTQTVKGQELSVCRVKHANSATQNSQHK
jgi:hypothetical protein